jgi:hypothetical protein
LQQAKTKPLKRFIDATFGFKIRCREVTKVHLYTHTHTATHQNKYTKSHNLTLAMQYCGSSRIQALVLTEGAAVFAASHPDIALCGVYVNSPLIWGVHVGTASPFTCFEDMRGESLCPRLLELRSFEEDGFICAYIEELTSP